MKQNKPIKICKFVEGSFLPAFDGASERFSQGLMALAADNQVEPLAIHCFRGWSDLNLIAQQNFKTIALPARFYYHNPSILSTVINQYQPQLLELNDLELGLSMGLRLLQNHHVPIVFDAQFVSSELMAAYVDQQAEPDRARIMERKLGQIVSGVSCFTDQDRRSLMQTMNLTAAEVIVIPMGADVRRIHFRKIKPNDNVILFIGNMFFKPNQEAVEYIGDQLIPQLTQLYPKLIFRFVGDCPQSLKEQYQQTNVIFTGRIPNINQAFENTRLCLSPIITGGGMRTKSLTYMASGVPTVTNKAGIVGINDQDSVITASLTNNQFLQAIINLLDDFETAKLLGQKARIIVDQYYTWEIFAKKYTNFYNQAINNQKTLVNFSPIQVNKNPFWLEELIAKGRFQDKLGDDDHVFLLGQGQYHTVTIKDSNLQTKIKNFLKDD